MGRIAGLLGESRETRRNTGYYLLKDGLLASGNTLCGTLLMQPFLVEMGLDNARIGILGSAASVAFAAGMLLLAGYSDRARRSLAAIAACSALYIAAPAVLAVSGALRAGGARAGAVFAVLLAATVLQNVCGSFRSMLEFRICGRLFNQRELGMFFGLDGAACNAVSVCLGLAASAVLAFMGYPSGFVACFCCSIVFYALSAWAVLGIRLPAAPVLPSDKPEGTAAGFLSVVRSGEFMRLALPHFARGLEIGAVYFILLVGISRFGLGAEYGAYLTVVIAVAGICGSLLFSAGVRRFSAGAMCGLGGLVVASGLVGIALAQSVWLFAALCFMTIAGQTLLDQGVPVGCYAIVRHERIGAYTGARMTLTMAGSAVSMWAIGLLLDRVGPLPIFSAVAAAYAACGLMYRREFRILSKAWGDRDEAAAG